MWEIIKKGANEHILKLLLPALGSGSIWLFAQVQGLDFMSAVIVCSIVFVVVFLRLRYGAKIRKESARSKPLKIPNKVHPFHLKHPKPWRRRHAKVFSCASAGFSMWQSPDNRMSHPTATRRAKARRRTPHSPAGSR